MYTQGYRSINVKNKMDFWRVCVCVGGGGGGGGGGYVPDKLCGPMHHYLRGINPSNVYIWFTLQMSERKAFKMKEACRL